MDISLFATVSKIPISLNGNENITSDGGLLFHGIISRGMIHKFEEAKIDRNLWFKYVPFISDTTLKIQDPLLERLQNFALDCKLLSFSQSTLSARKFIKEYVSNQFDDDNIKCELCSLQEGNTSSVWKVTLSDLNDCILETFIINVARDHDAGNELQNTSGRMKLLAESYPEIPVAKVYAIEKVNIDYYGSSVDVVITRNELIPNSCNIYHLLDENSGEYKYYLVDGFLSMEYNSGMAEIIAREAPKKVSDEVNKIIKLFNQSSVKDTSIGFEINEGDLIWDGKRVVVVSVS